MRRLIWIVVLAALAWSAYWVVGAAALRRGIDSALGEMRASGWQVAIENRRIRGFPNRFDTTLSAPRISAPDTSVTWSAPFVQVLALSYRPNKMIFAFADTQTVEGPFGTVRIATDRARGSVTLARDASLALRHSEFVVDGVEIRSGGRLGVGELLVASRLPPDDDSGRTHNIGASVRDLELPDRVAAALGPSGSAPVGHAMLDATLRLARPLDRAVLSAGIPRPEALRVDRLSIDWGEIDLSASGEVEVGADGRLVGTLELEFGNWRRTLDLLAGLGLVPSEQLPALTRGLDLITGLSDDPATLAAPLTFRGGETFLGPVPLGPAPRIAPS